MVALTHWIDRKDKHFMLKLFWYPASHLSFRVEPIYSDYVSDPNHHIRWNHCKVRIVWSPSSLWLCICSQPSHQLEPVYSQICLVPILVVIMYLIPTITPVGTSVKSDLSGLHPHCDYVSDPNHHTSWNQCKVRFVWFPSSLWLCIWSQPSHQLGPVHIQTYLVHILIVIMCLILINIPDGTSIQSDLSGPHPHTKTCVVQSFYDQALPGHTWTL